jgi:hypothetical protein
MKHFRIFLAITFLVLASLACNALSRVGGNSPDAQPQIGEPEPAIVEPAETEVPSSSDETDENNDAVVADGNFTMTEDAFNVTDMGDAGLIYYTKLSVEDVMKFYRDELTAKGYKEREILTVIFDGGFSMVFDGDPSGKAVAIQSVDLGDGSRTVTITMGEY